VWVGSRHTLVGNTTSGRLVRFRLFLRLRRGQVGEAFMEGAHGIGQDQEADAALLGLASKPYI
jgi:hypothetical protein